MKPLHLLLLPPVRSTASTGLAFSGWVSVFNNVPLSAAPVEVPPSSLT